MSSAPTRTIDCGEPDRSQGDPALLRALADPATYGRPGRVMVHETHASWVFVAGERAYKVKKPVAMPFLDYRTLARRRAACQEEVRVNDELAPGIYLGVRAIVKDARGFALAGEDAADAVEYAVEMRTFREQDSLAGLIARGALTREHIRAVAARLADFHRRAPTVPGGSARAVLAMWQANVRELGDLGEQLPSSPELLQEFGEAFVHAHTTEIEQRRRAGMVRDGHGDLRCEHVFAAPAVRVVDRIEFNPKLRHTDVACDLAFLAMDLEAHGQRWAAAELARAYVQAGIDGGSEALRSFYAAYRALVRAKVALFAAREHGRAAAAQQRTLAYELAVLAERLCWRARAPLAILVCGPAASGKSTLAAELARRSGIEVVASDAVRKATAGVRPGERAPAECYSARFTQITYERLAGEAQRALHQDRAVIVDATCRARRDRAPLLRVLRESGATVLAVRCVLARAVALTRARARSRDPSSISDATPGIVAEQHRSFQELEELDPESVLALDTAQPLEQQLAAVTRAIDCALAARRPPARQRRNRSGGAGRALQAVRR